MNRRTIQEAVVFVLLVVGGALLRDWLRQQDVHGWFPILAIALFAGYYFRWKLIAAALPLLTMAITDTWINGYEPGVKVVVYAMAAFPVLFWIGQHTASVHSPASTKYWRSLLANTFFSAVAYFLVTNFAVFLAWYSHTWTGLAECYWLAVPFFRTMVIANGLGTVTLFGIYHLGQLAVGIRTGVRVPEVR